MEGRSVFSSIGQGSFEYVWEKDPELDKFLLFLGDQVSPEFDPDSFGAVDFDVDLVNKVISLFNTLKKLVKMFTRNLITKSNTGIQKPSEINIL